MKTVFVINPQAGKGNRIKTLIDKINSLSGFDIEIYITKCRGDATTYVRDFCQNFGKARFIACGGDGTLNEVLNGAIGFAEAEIGVMPIGTGNDFCRNFSSEFDFFDITNQINGKTQMCDAIHYTTVSNGVKRDGYCVNMINIGFDCNVADLKSKIEKKPFVFGSMSYIISIFVMLVSKRGANLRIEIDNEEKYCGKLLLTSIANGCYCGGGIKSNPLAHISDGYININIIKNVSRLKFISLLPHYMRGDYLQLKNIDKVITTQKCQKVKISPLDGKMRLCVDGEIIDALETEFEICLNAFNFVLPQKQDIRVVKQNNMTKMIGK